MRSFLEQFGQMDFCGETRSKLLSRVQNPWFMAKLRKSCFFFCSGH